jgi:hypothetical protein
MDDNIGGQVLGLVFLALFIVGGLWLFGFNFGQYEEGTVDYSDCQQIIMVKNSDWHQIFFHKWICNPIKTQSGAIMGGECARIEKDHSYPTPLCARAYVYEMEAVGCTGNTKDGVAYPYLGYDDKCYTTPQ